MGKEEINAFLGSGTVYKGDLSFQGTVRIDGQFEGEIHSEGTLVVGKEARLVGVFQVGQLMLSGSINGEVRVTGRVVLHKGGNLTGTLRTPSLAMEDGAILEGQVSMGSLSAGEIHVVSGKNPNEK